MTALPNREASETIERQILKLVSLRMAGLGPDADLTRFLEMCPPAIRDKLAEWKIIAKERAAAGRSIQSHIDEWLEYLRSKGNTPKYCKESKSKVGRIVAQYGWNGITDMSSTDMHNFINARRAAGASAATINNHIRAMKCLCNWLEDEKRITDNPMKKVPILNEKTDRRIHRRRLVVDDMRTLMTATFHGKKYHGLTGPQRYLLYRTAAHTGLRWSELRSLCRESFDFDTKPPTVLLKADDAKNRDEATLVLREDLAEELKAYMALFMPAEKAFPGMWKDKGAEMLRRDLIAAGIPYEDESGRRFDFHSFRGQFATLLNQSGTPLITAQKMLRHSDPKLTANLYTDVFIEDKAKELSKIPSTAIGSGQEAARKTGADGAPVAIDAPQMSGRPVGSKNPNSDGEIRTYTNKKSDEITGRKRLIQMLEEMQDLDFKEDKGIILLFPPVAQGKMMCGDEKTLIPQGDKGILKLAPPAGFEPATCGLTVLIKVYATSFRITKYIDMS
ncbi:MAG: site-specific integrase [Planctomycetota bacterium]|nr:site-specific integrase [Planctomycetota bacterium]